MGRRLGLRGGLRGGALFDTHISFSWYSPLHGFRIKHMFSAPRSEEVNMKLISRSLVL